MLENPLIIGAIIGLIGTALTLVGSLFLVRYYMKRLIAQNKLDEAGAEKDNAETVQILARVTKEKIDEALKDARESKDMYTVLLDRTDGIAKITGEIPVKQLLQNGKAQGVFTVEIMNGHVGTSSKH